MTDQTSLSQKIGHYSVDLLARAVFGLALALPYNTRLHTAGWFFAHVFGPLSGARKRIRKNLAIAWPDLPQAEVERLCRAVPDNFGRAMIEIYSGQEFVDHVKDTQLQGPGLALVKQRQAENKPIVFVSGHFGSYDAPRGYFYTIGHPVGGLYRDMSNPHFNKHYVDAMLNVSKPLFARDRRGMAQMLKFLKGGGAIALLTDQYNIEGPMITFFGQPTRTAVSAAEIALKYDAPLVPVYTIRNPDGITSEIHIEDPITPSEPLKMMQAYYDSLERRIRANPEQWLWIHKRWRPERDGTASSKIDSTI